MHRALGIGGLCGLVWVGCTNNAGSSGATADGGGSGSSGAGSSGAGSGGAASSGGSGGSTSGTTGSSSGGSGSGSGGGTSGAQSLIGTWDLMTTPTGRGAVSTTVVVGQDSLTVTSPGFTLTAVRTGSSEAYSVSPEGIVLTAMQTAASFDAGILPFNLGGTWSMQIVQGTSIQATCTLSVSSAEIDGACTYTQGGPFFSFTTKKMSSATSALGDFGGKWMNAWTWLYQGGGNYMCELDFLGKGITTCSGTNGGTSGHSLQGITFTYDGASTASGAAQGWAEYSAMRQ
jgi:hypothetical protein